MRGERPSFQEVTPARLLISLPRVPRRRFSTCGRVLIPTFNLIAGEVVDLDAVLIQRWTCIT